MIQNMQTMPALRHFLGEVAAIETLSAAEELALCREVDAEYRGLTETLLAVPWASQRLRELCAVAGAEATAGDDRSPSVDDVLHALRQRARRQCAAAARSRVDQALAGGRVDGSTPHELRASVEHALSGQPLRSAFLERLAERLIDCERGSRVRAVERRLQRVRDRKAALLRANLPLVLSVAIRHRRPDVPLLDLVREATRTLTQVVERFDYGGESDFSAYARWAIRQAVRVRPGACGR